MRTNFEIAINASDQWRRHSETSQSLSMNQIFRFITRFQSELSERESSETHALISGSMFDRNADQIIFAEELSVLLNIDNIFDDITDDNLFVECQALRVVRESGRRQTCIRGTGRRQSLSHYERSLSPQWLL